MDLKSVKFIVVPKDNKLPIRIMTAMECISSHDPQFCYGYPIWDRGGKSENPFYWANESMRWYYIKVTGEDIKENEPAPIGYNPFEDYQNILDEFHKNWKEIIGSILEHSDESITLKYKYFKIVSNVDTSILTY